MCGFIVTLSTEDQDRLFKYLTCEEEVQFREILQLFQEFVSKKLQSRTSGNTYPDSPVVDATKCIAILCKKKKNCVILVGY